MKKRMNLGRSEIGSCRNGKPGVIAGCCIKATWYSETGSIPWLSPTEQCKTRSESWISFPLPSLPALLPEVFKGRN